MNCTKINKGLLLVLTFGCFILSSCEADDVCLPEEAPYVSIEFRYPNSTTALEDTIFYKAYVNDSLLIGEGDNRKELSMLNLPIQVANDLTVKYVLEQGSTYKTIQINGTDTITSIHTAPKDSIYIRYQIDNKYNSKGCGFGVYFKNATIQHSNDWIQSSEIVNSTIDNATSTNFILFAEPRSY